MVLKNLSKVSNVQKYSSHVKCPRDDILNQYNGLKSSQFVETT